MLYVGLPIYDADVKDFYVLSYQSSDYFCTLRGGRQLEKNVYRGARLHYVAHEFNENTHKTFHVAGTPIQTAKRLADFWAIILDKFITSEYLLNINTIVVTFFHDITD
jgi:hypothetical protein